MVKKKKQKMPKPPMIENQSGVLCKNYTGLRSGKMVLQYPCAAPDKRRNNRNQYWLAKCDCGNTHVFQGRLVVRGTITQCPKCRTV